MSARVSWQQIKSIIAASGDGEGDLFLCVLPHAGRHVLMSLMERLTWEATYRIEGYDYSDWDALQSYIAATEYGLQRGVNMDDLIAAVVAIKDAVNALEPIINNQANSLNCCPEPVLPTQSDVVQDEGSVPQPVQDLGYADDWDAFRGYLCVAANTLIDAVIEILEQYETIASAGLVTLGAIVALTGVFGPLGLVFGLTIGAAASIWGVLINLGDITILEDLRDQLNADRNVISCFIQGSLSAEDAYSAWLAYAAGFGAVQETILRNAVSQNTFNALFNGEHGGESIRLGDYTPGDCDCEEIIDYNGWTILPATGFTFVSSNNLNSLSYSYVGGRLTVDGTTPGQPAVFNFTVDAPANSEGHAGYLQAATYGHAAYNGFVQWGDPQGVNDLVWESGQGLPNSRFRGRGTSLPSAELKAIFDSYATGSPGSWLVASWDSEIADGKVTLRLQRGGGELHSNRAVHWEVDLFIIVPTPA